MVTPDVLAEQCAAVGRRLCSYAGPVRKIANERFDFRLTEEQWAQHAQVAAFMAFVECAGDREHPEQFDWTSHQYFYRALSLLQIYVIGSHSDIYDTIIRERTRKAGDDVGELSWDAWRATYGFNDLHDESTETKLFNYKQVRHKAMQHYDDCWDQTDRVELGEQLIIELTRLLRPQEAVWLIRRYRDGVSTAALAKELMAKDARYQAADGLTRATRYIDVVVHRAKKKCRDKLAGRWHALAQEVA